MNILVLGSTGMAGHMISHYLKNKKYNVSTAARSYADYIIDVQNASSLEQLKDTISEFDFVVNCIGVLVKDSTDNPDQAILVNSWFPRFLELVTRNTKTKIIHLSTDCVFSGSTGFYKEFDLHTENNVYGKSKSLGEINNTKDITFRMSIIGPELKQGTGLFNWLVNNSQSQVPGWENAYWNGMTTLQLAKCIESFINNPIHRGVYHLVNNNVYTNKYELLCLINTIFDCKKIIIKARSEKDINKILTLTYPSYYDIPNYETQITELRDYMEVYDKIK